MQREPNVITSIKHPALADARRKLGQAGKAPPEAFVIDGLKFVSQALASRATVESVFFLADADDGEHAALLRRARDAGIECFFLSKGVFFKLLGLRYETAAGVLAIVAIKPLTAAQVAKDLRQDAWVMLGERIQDPRNIGVLIRNADATGVSCAAFTGDSANPYSRESVRSSTGSILRVPLAIADSMPVFVRRLKERGAVVIGTSARADTVYWRADFRRPCVILFGNEAAGLSDEAQALCDTLVAIPVLGGASSLNVTVASGVILCEAARQHLAGGHDTTHPE